MIRPILFRLAERYINRRFMQSLLFILGVALGVAMVIAIDVANGSAQRAFDLSAQSISGNATHQIIGTSDSLSTTLFDQIRVDLGLRTSAPIVEEYVRGVQLGNQTLRLLGVDPFSEAPFRPYLTSVDVDNENTDDSAFEALNAFIAEPNTVLMSETLAGRYGIAIGDSITLRVGTTTADVRVVGMLRPNDDLSEQALDDLLIADIATAQELVGRPDTLTRIDLILPTDNTDEWVSQIEAILPSGAQLTPTSRNVGTLAQMTGAFELNLQALSLLALVVGVFLIYNTVTFSVVQRRPMLGILRSLGATKYQIFSLILGEAVVLALVGTLLGLGLGIIFGRFAVNIVAQTISDLYFTVNVQRINVAPFTLIKGASIGIFASLVAAALPAYLATRTPPAGVMRRSDQEQSARALLPYITLAAIGLLIIGVLLLQIPTQDIIISFVALFAIVVGGAFFTPIVLVGMMTIATPIMGRLFGVVGRMGARAVVQSLSRTSVAVAALTIAVSVIVGVSVMIASFRSTVSVWLENTLGSDIYVSPPLLTSNRSTVDVDASIRDIIRTVEGVDRLSASRSISVSAPDFPDFPPANLIAVDFDISNNRRLAWTTAPNGDWWSALEAGGVMVSEPFAYRRNIQQGDSLRLLTDRGIQTFPIVGVYYDYSTDQGTVYMTDGVYRSFYDDPYISSVGIFITPDADIDVVMTNIRDALGDTDLLVQANRDLRAGVFTIFDNAFSITIALRLLATVVAFIGILSALLSLQLENTRQYGVLRANGMTPRQLWQFTLIQTGLMGIVAGTLALPIGLALAMVLLFVINVRSFGWTMDFYFMPEEFVLAFLVAVVAAFLAGIYPAWRMSRLQTSQALRSE
ncbi:MAG: FtsX-like permease family protein [bacterium]|nr:FtsX-like permease family protein [bacterium]